MHSTPGKGVAGTAVGAGRGVGVGVGVAVGAQAVAKRIAARNTLIKLNHLFFIVLSPPE
jgi:hypothetical protein